MDTFGTKLHALRLDNGWSLEDMAAVLGTTKQVLSRYERDIRTPKITTVTSYAFKLGVPLSALMPDGEQSDGEKNDGDIMALREQLRRSPGMRMLFDAAKCADERDLIAAAKMIQALSEDSED